MTRVIAVTGGKGGVGKTNISLNLALVLAELGHRVCLFDADLGLANINVLLGIYPEYDLEDVILNSKSIHDILIHNYQGIDIIPGSSGVERLANLTQDEINRLVESFATLESYEYFILDTSAGISRSVISFCLAATDIALVITPEPTSLTDAYALLKVLCFNGFTGKPKIIVNQCKNTSVASAAYNKLKEVVHKYLTIDIVPLGIIVRDKKFPEAVQRQQPLVRLYPQSSAAKCFQVIASRILANKPEPFTTTGIAGFWSKFLAIARTPLKIPEKPADDRSEPVASPEHKSPDTGTLATPAVAQSAAEAAAPVVPVEPRASDHSPENPEKHSAPASEALLEQLGQSVQLPTLPHILVKLIDACGTETTDLRDIADIIEKDPALCSRILRIVNSSYYSFSHTISDFNQALSLLGIDAIRNIAISTSVYQVFNGLHHNSTFNLKMFWWHSFLCAVTAQLVAKAISYTRPEEAFLAGLLHDIGKAILASSPLTGSNTNGKDASPDEPTPSPQPAFEHNTVGAWVIRRWQLQSLIADAVLYHHESPERIMHALPLVKIIYAANLLSGVPGGADEQAKASVATLFGIDLTTIDTLIAQAGEQVKHIAQTLDITIPETAATDTHHEKADRAVAEHLTQKVRELSLVQGTLQQFISAPTLDALLRSFYDGLAVLLKIPSAQVRVFVYNAEQQLLTGTAPHLPLMHDHMNELTIPTSMRTSMVSTALAEGHRIDSFSYVAHAALSIIDEQLIRLLGKEGMVCFPLCAHGTPVGAVVMGIDRSDEPSVHTDMGLLTVLLGYLSLALEAELLRQTQAQKILAERLAASRAIARKVAHEVNNPLSIIKNYLKILEMKCTDHHVPVDEMGILNEEIDRVAGIIDSLSDFSRPRLQTLASVSINALLQDIVTLTAPSFAQHHITVVFTPDEAVPPIISDKNGLKQIFINLIKNAAEAIVKDGTISLATRYLAEQSAVEITVADTGPGLPDPVKSRLFEPYLSTKGRKHAGLGLSIVYTTVQELSGTISCTSEKGSGTTFTIILPVTARPAR